MGVSPALGGAGVGLLKSLSSIRWRARERDCGVSRWLPNTAGSANMQGMSTLMEIEQAAVKLPAGEQKQLLRFLLRIVPVNEAELPEPRIFSNEEIQAWLVEDEASMRRFREGT